MRSPDNLLQRGTLATMTVSRESPVTQGARMPDKALDSRTRPIKHLKIATYNVRSLLASGKEHQLIEGCTKYKINLLAIQEHRTRLKEATFEWNKERTWLKYLASANGQRGGGIGFYFYKETIYAVQEVKQVSERIIVAHLNGNPQMTVVNFYAPTNEKSVDNDKAKDTFYKDLYNLLSNIPPHNVLIVLGDFNARIGKDSHQSYPTVTGPFCSEEQTNENGQRLVDLCIENNLRPVSTRFPHKLGRLWTWTHSSGTHSQIDHILITSKWVNSVRNCRAYNTIQ